MKYIKEKLPELLESDEDVAVVYDLTFGKRPIVGQHFEKFSLNYGDDFNFKRIPNQTIERLPIERFYEDWVDEEGKTQTHQYSFAVDSKVRNLCELLFSKERQSLEDCYNKSRKQYWELHDKVTKYNNLPWYKKLFTQQV